MAGGCVIQNPFVARREARADLARSRNRLKLDSYSGNREPRKHRVLVKGHQPVHGID